MKKLLFLILVCVTAFNLFALPAAEPTVAANRYVELIVAKGSAWDTLSGVDSATFATKITIPFGCYTVLTRAAITGGGADSVNAQVVVDAYDINNNFLYRTAVDTFTTASSACPGEQIAIPIYSTIFGDKFTIKIISLSGAGAGGVQILNSMRLYVRKLFIETKQLVGGN